MIEHLKESVRALVQAPFFRVPCRTNRWRERLYERYSLGSSSGSRCLDIGSGPSPRNPLRAEHIVGADIRASDRVVECDLSGGRLPFDDSSFDAITAFDVLEHIPRVFPRPGPGGGIRFPFVELMSEVHRCLRVGGIFLSSTPCYPFGVAAQDPTHVNLITDQTMGKYFCGEQPWARMYGFVGGFLVLEHALVNSHYVAVIRRP